MECRAARSGRRALRTGSVCGVGTERQGTLTRASDLGSVVFRKAFWGRWRERCLGTAGRWLAGLQLFPVRADVTFACLSHCPPSFVRDLLI